ncbi:flagellar biosynthesis anti-sigma factor FlgM [uncultured Oscillibacter sp.]|uniref:flagellar biosynthesis anti-sigma factor FlgM n=1 Tax=uncultured Oscillibacter sp. TaxID=876091 RepID=UPI0025D591CB|nr:flagellar biosynthesis anti-sigma factor FlgM [uncultured Oscillibacter sp.]
MLTSSSRPSPVSSVAASKSYYSTLRRGSSAQSAVEHKYDSATFSPLPEGRSAFQMQLVSRLSQEVRTATTTGDIQALRQSVSTGEYTPDPMAIAGRMLFLTEA